MQSDLLWQSRTRYKSCKHTFLSLHVYWTEYYPVRSCWASLIAWSVVILRGAFCRGLQPCSGIRWPIFWGRILSTSSNQPNNSRRIHLGSTSTQRQIFTATRTSGHGLCYRQRKCSNIATHHQRSTWYSPVSLTALTDHQCRNLANSQTQHTTTRHNHPRQHQHSDLATLPRPLSHKFFSMGIIRCICVADVSYYFDFFEIQNYQLREIVFVNHFHRLVLWDYI